MTRRFLLLLALAALACGSDDGGSGASQGKPSFAFVPEGNPSGVAVTLRQKELGKDRLVLELVGHSLSELYGAAFRISYDPGALTFQALELSPAWKASPKALGSAKTPGLLVGTLTHQGKAAGISGGEVVLGTLTFALTEQKPGVIAFVGDRSALVGVDGKRVAGASWAGGALVKN